MENNSRLTFLDLLALVFITLKLLGKINWSWGWVLSPITIPILLTCIVFIIEEIGGN